jgi:hypothetical protein
VSSIPNNERFGRIGFSLSGFDFWTLNKADGELNRQAEARPTKGKHASI